MAFCLSFPKWCNTYTLAEKIKALEHQTFSTHFTSKFMLFWITQKLTFFTHPNIKIAKNGNAPIHWRGFHAFFKNSWPSPPPKISRIVTSFSNVVYSCTVQWHGCCTVVYSDMVVLHRTVQWRVGVRCTGNHPLSNILTHLVKTCWYLVSVKVELFDLFDKKHF